MRRDCISTRRGNETRRERLHFGHAEGGAERLHESDECERRVRSVRRHEHEFVERQLVGADVEHLALEERHLHLRPTERKLLALREEEAEHCVCDSRLSSARLVAGGEDDGVEHLESAATAEHEVAPLERFHLDAHQADRPEQQRRHESRLQMCKASTGVFTNLASSQSWPDAAPWTHHLSKRVRHLRGRVLSERLNVGLEAVQCVRVLPAELRAQRRVRFFCTHRNQNTVPKYACTVL